MGFCKSLILLGVELELNSQKKINIEHKINTVTTNTIFSFFKRSSKPKLVSFVRPLACLKCWYSVPPSTPVEWPRWQKQKQWLSGPSEKNSERKSSCTTTLLLSPQWVLEQGLQIFWVWSKTLGFHVLLGFPKRWLLSPTSCKLGRTAQKATGPWRYYSSFWSDLQILSMTLLCQRRELWPGKPTE